MTEKLPPLSTQIVPPSQIALPAPSFLSAKDASHQIEVNGEEPYTIKCICRFSDDDGNTIYCETCDTWQHIECFYPNNMAEACRPDFAHSCHECKPRLLDRQQAIERQKSRLSKASAVEATTDKKAKRPPSKSHKKKPKPTEIQVQGHHPTDVAKQASSHDQPPAKKTKNSHKVSISISSQAAKRSPPFAPARASITHGQPPSPATTPPDLPQDFEIHSYSPGFISRQNQPVLQVHTNSFASLNTPNTLSLWLRDQDKLRQETGVQSFDDVFRHLPSSIDTLTPPVHLVEKQMALPPDTVIRWQVLTMLTAVGKDAPLIELNGVIGFQKDYCADKSNGYEELSSPLPFVFFHKMLPLYIDARNEGSNARYVRRSCKPNAYLETFVSSGLEYRFWLVSDRPIDANEPITIPWDFRFPIHSRPRMLYLLGVGDEEQDEREMDDAEYQQLGTWLHLMLSEYGGCACELGSGCAFVRFHRTYLARAQARNTIKKKSRKVRTHAPSPTSTGHATNSRAASEGRPDEGPEGDGASVSGSSRSKPPSRDMTPAHTTPAPRQGSFDTLGILTEPTDRDKRKVAMVEDSFRRMEQQHQPQRKKKRVSDGTTSSNASKSKSKGPTGQSNGVQYVDVGTSRSKSGSPASATSPKTVHPFRHPASASRQSSAPLRSRNASVAPCGTYCEASVQTDPVVGDWFREPGLTPAPKRKVVSLSKRLLENRHRGRQEEEEYWKKRQSMSSLADSSDAMDVESSPTATRGELKPAATSPVTAVVPELLASAMTTHGCCPPADIPMTDAPPITTPPLQKSRPPAPPPPVLVTEVAPSAVKNKSPELRVQMPPVPAFNGTVSTALSATTPVSATDSIVQTPLSATSLGNTFPLSAANGATLPSPSPVKKKLSLSDYTKSRKAAASRPSAGTTLKTLMTHLDDPKSSIEGLTVTESPAPDKANQSSLTATAVGTTVNGSST